MSHYFLNISIFGIALNLIVILWVGYSLSRNSNLGLFLFEIGAVSHLVVQAIYLCLTLQKWKIEIINKSHGDLFQKMIMFCEPTGIILCAISIILIAKNNWKYPKKNKD